MPEILIVDDELSMREFLSILLEKEGFKTLTADNGVSALKTVNNSSIDLVISDIRMPGMGGLELLAEIKNINKNLPVVMITAYASPEDAVMAMKNGAFDYITKPFKVDEIKSIISTALASGTNQEKTAEEPVNEFEGIIGKSQEIRKIFDMIQRIAPTHANVMIYGESGTGKGPWGHASENF